MDVPVKYNNSQVLVKSYQNSIAVDCKNDRLVILVGRVFSVEGVKIYVTSKPEIVNNTHEVKAPTTQLIDLFCSPILERYKEIRPKINT